MEAAPGNRKKAASERMWTCPTYAFSLWNHAKRQKRTHVQNLLFPHLLILLVRVNVQEVIRLVLEQFLGSYDRLAAFAAHILRYARNKLTSIFSNHCHFDPTPPSPHENCSPSLTGGPSPKGLTESSSWWEQLGEGQGILNFSHRALWSSHLSECPTTCPALPAFHCFRASQGHSFPSSSACLLDSG